jgi:hypothetical protein
VIGIALIGYLLYRYRKQKWGKVFCGLVAMANPVPIECRRLDQEGSADLISEPKPPTSDPGEATPYSHPTPLPMLSPECEFASHSQIPSPKSLTAGHLPVTETETDPMSSYGGQYPVLDPHSGSGDMSQVSAGVASTSAATQMSKGVR